MSALEVLAGHLNVSTRGRVRKGDVALALVAGRLDVVEDDLGRALIAGIFSESTPDLIMRATVQAGGTAAASHALYMDSLEQGMPRAPAWEAFIGEVL